MSRFIDLSGQPFSRLTVLSFIGRSRRHSLWLCQCVCGNQAQVTSNHLRTGHTQSCGCLHQDIRHKRLINLLGKRFERLTVLLYVGENIFGKVEWFCQCDCGNTTTTTGDRLRRKEARSCGCLATEAKKKAGARRKVYGLTQTKAFRAWYGMQQRCSNPWDKNYGGRGITICERWKDPANFFVDMGEPAPGLTLERLDNNGPYAPENCVWADVRTQSRNRRSNQIITAFGKTQLLVDWENETGISRHKIQQRLAGGESPENALAGLKRPYGKKLQITYRGETLLLMEWARKLQIPHQALHYRIKAGWNVEKAMTTPINPRLARH